MIIVRIKMNALPEKQKEVMQTLLSMTDTAGHVEGCLSYEGFCDLEDNYVCIYRGYGCAAKFGT
jgi:quinol monooxygenase YgiN